MSERDICKKCGQMFTYHGGGQCPGYNEHIDMTNKTEHSTDGLLNKPAREFWINSHPERGYDVVSLENIGGTHVIEYSAYAAEKEARQKAEIERDEYKYGYKEFCDQLNKASDTTMAALETAMRFSKERDQLKEKLELAGKSLEKILYQVRVDNTEIVNRLQEKLEQSETKLAVAEGALRSLVGFEPFKNTLEPYRASEALKKLEGE